MSLKSLCIDLRIGVQRECECGKFIVIEVVSRRRSILIYYLISREPAEQFVWKAHKSTNMETIIYSSNIISHPLMFGKSLIVEKYCFFFLIMTACTQLYILWRRVGGKPLYGFFTRSRLSWLVVSSQWRANKFQPTIYITCCHYNSIGVTASWEFIGSRSCHY